MFRKDPGGARLMCQKINDKVNRCKKHSVVITAVKESRTGQIAELQQASVGAKQQSSVKRNRCTGGRADGAPLYSSA